MKCKIRRMTIWTGLCIMLCSFLFTGRVYAQNFYGEGNVLIAVDMSPYAENDDVHFEEGTMGTLQWGADAPSGESTRPAFYSEPYRVDANIPVPSAGDYNIKSDKYTVGKKIFLPFRPDAEDYDWISEDNLPQEVFNAGKHLFLIKNDGEHIKTENGKKWYYLPIENKGDEYPDVDFIEIECVAVTNYSTVWEYTGTVYSTRPSFSIEDYSGAVNLTQKEIKHFEDTCDEAYTKQAAIFGDPHFEDKMGDCDGKAAYVALDYSKISSKFEGYYSDSNTDCYGFDCLVVNSSRLPNRRRNVLKEDAEASFIKTLIHELNHYILFGCTGHESANWSTWIGECLAQRGVCTIRPESYAYKSFSSNVTDYSSRLRMIPGIRWSKTPSEHNPIFNQTTYALGASFMEYIERETGNPVDGRLWTDFFTSQGDIPWSMTYEKLNAYLSNKTGVGLDAWLAQFMAAVVIGDENGSYCMGDAKTTADFRVNPYVFYRTPEEFGKNLGFDGAADYDVIFQVQDWGLDNLRGGGSVYAYRNDAGGKIAITGADDDWYFFAVNKDLSTDEISISSADELRKIGKDTAYPLYGRYVLTADIDLGGASHPWTPIGYGENYFSGTIDGKGHTISGLFISTGNDKQGLFGGLSSGAVVRDLNVTGVISGASHIGGIAGYSVNGLVTGCTTDVTIHGTQDCGGIIGYHILGTISDCTACGTVTAEDGYCGGIAGFGRWAKICDCRSFAAVNGDIATGGIVGSCASTEIAGCRNDGDVSGNSLTGGITGSLCDEAVACIRECYQTGTVSGKESTGGIAGVIRIGTVQNSYNAGRVSGGEMTGGIAGLANRDTSTVENCYSYQKDLAVIGVNEGDVATVTSCYILSDTKGDGMLTASDFARKENFPGWDFGSIWNLENSLRPVLRNNIFKDSEAEIVPNAVTPVNVPSSEKPGTGDGSKNSTNSTGSTNLWTSYSNDSSDSGSSSGSSHSVWNSVQGKGSNKAYYRKTGKNTVAYYSCEVKKKARQAVVPATVKIGKKTYRVTTISSYAFTGCDNLRTVTIGKNVTKIKPYAFKGCDKLTRLKLATEKLTKQGVKNSLSGSKVNTITLIKNAVEKIESYKKIFSPKNSGAAGKVKVEL